VFGGTIANCYANQITETLHVARGILVARFEIILAELQKNTDEMLVMNDILFNDVKTLLDTAESEVPTGANKAAAISAMFAFIETSTYCLLKIARNYYDFRVARFGMNKWEEKDLLKLKPIRDPIKNLKNAYKVFHKATSSDYTLIFDNDDWEIVKTALPIRKRLTHPKRLTDLQVSNDDLSFMYRTFVLLFFKFTLELSHGHLAMAIVSKEQAIKENNDKLVLHFESSIKALEDHVLVQAQNFDKFYKPIKTGI
jgi:hypothetical protein